MPMKNFAESAVFTLNELVGKPHNIVRHPDMPKEAFKDLWATLKHGKPWNGLVKNRCKNGDYYWVNAYVAPIRDNQVTVGYVSSRIKADAEQIRAAEVFYRDLRQGRSRLDAPGRQADSEELAVETQPFLAGLVRQVSADSWHDGIGICHEYVVGGWCRFYRAGTGQGKRPYLYSCHTRQGFDSRYFAAPEYLVESWLTTLEMSLAPAEELPKLIGYSKQLRNDYETRYLYWKDNLEPGRLKELMAEDAYKPAMAFFEVRDNQLIPALLQGDKQQADSLMPILRASYEAHRKVVDEIVKLANVRNKTDEANAAEYIKQRYVSLGVLILLVTAFVCALSGFVVRRLTRQLGGEPGYAVEIIRHIAVGNLAPLILDQKTRKNSLLESITLDARQITTIADGIQRDADSVAGGAGQLASASLKVQTVASDSSRSAASIAASTEQMKANISLVTGNVDQAMAVSLESGKFAIRAP